MRFSDEELSRRLAQLEAEGDESTERVDVLNELAEGCFFGDDLPRLAELAREAIALSERLSYDKGRARGLTTLARGHVMGSRIKEALEALEAAEEAFEHVDDDDGSVVIAIADDGKGIPSEELQGIFDVGLSRSSWRVRLGMGLATAYRAVAQHGGRIEVESEPGRVRGSPSGCRSEGSPVDATSLNRGTTMVPDAES